jgi:hypothetical protein
MKFILILSQPELVLQKVRDGGNLSMSSSDWECACISDWNCTGVFSLKEILFFWFLTGSCATKSVVLEKSVTTIILACRGLIVVCDLLMFRCYHDFPSKFIWILKINSGKFGYHCLKTKHHQFWPLCLWNYSILHFRNTFVYNSKFLCSLLPLH